MIYYTIEKKVAVHSRRNKLEIYYAIMTSIQSEARYGKIRPTRIQFLSNMSYDKINKYFDELENSKMIRKKPLVLTDKGKEFLVDYEKIHDFMIKLGLKYVDDFEVRL
ncbi:MAG: transcriptional regulator [Thaumarchaeota archaeon]|nr:transcriptional regulator [Nitrososphaerota archaeon]MBI3639177.1 transcriptional regulator [Nitrososphaerota archaeon]